MENHFKIITRVGIEKTSGSFIEEKTPSINNPSLRNRMDESLRMFPKPSQGFLHTKSMEFENEKRRKQTKEKLIKTVLPKDGSSNLFIENPRAKQGHQSITCMCYSKKLLSEKQIYSTTNFKTCFERYQLIAV